MVCWRNRWKRCYQLPTMRQCSPICRSSKSSPYWSNQYSLRRSIRVRSSETDRYGPYASLCNHTLTTLANLDDGLKIHFARSDPGCIKSSYKAVDVGFDRKSDVICTSCLVASDAYKTSPDSDDLRESCRGAPDTAFTWAQVLSCHEFKLSNHALKEKFKNLWEAKGAAYPYSDQQESPETHWDNLLDTVEQENPTSKSQQSAGRQVSGQEPMWSAQQPESQSAKAVSTRVRLEMLSHNLGIHHDVNLLIIGTSPCIMNQHVVTLICNRRRNVDLVFRQTGHHILSRNEFHSRPSPFPCPPICFPGLRFGRLGCEIDF